MRDSLVASTLSSCSLLQAIGLCLVLTACTAERVNIFPSVFRDYQARQGHKAIFINLPGRYYARAFGMPDPNAAKDAAEHECDRLAREKGIDESECLLVAVDNQMVFDPTSITDQTVAEENAIIRARNEQDFEALALLLGMAAGRIAATTVHHSFTGATPMPQHPRSEGSPPRSYERPATIQTSRPVSPGVNAVPSGTLAGTRPIQPSGPATNTNTRPAAVVTQSHSIQRETTAHMTSRQAVQPASIPSQNTAGCAALKTNMLNSTLYYQKNPTALEHDTQIYNSLCR
jgi:hypothetical protein